MTEPSLESMLSRPRDERRREYRYRFSQSVVFGLPVVALQAYGPALGPLDSDRWVSLLQALLAGWVVYVNLGMFAEGVLLRGRGLRGDLAASALAIALYLYSLISSAAGVAVGRLWYRPILFHVTVILLAGWTGWRWWQLARRSDGRAV